jgi:type III pantothenate kinase
MLLAVDAGNSDIVFGYYHEGSWLHLSRTPSLGHESSAHYELVLRQDLQRAGLPPERVATVVLSSVVPPLTPVLRLALATVFNQNPVEVGPAIFPELSVRIDNPAEIGADLVANAVAAFTTYRQNCVVVDFGTALTFTTVSGQGEILGVAIVPGLKTAVKALFANTAQLPEVPLVLPQSAIGKNTTHAIQAGILLGYEGLVRSLIARIRQELNGECIAIATGGLSSIIDTLRGEFVAIDPYLTLNGLRLIGERQQQGTSPILRGTDS